MSKIVCIPADNEGNKLYLKEFRIDKNKTFIKYKSTYNDMPFTETEIYLMDNNQNFVITGNDGTVLYRFSANWAIGLEI